MPARPPVIQRPLRLVAVPSGHPYVQHVSGDAADIELLADPPAIDGARDRWWPPAALTVPWLREHRDDIDLVHVHFGMESFTVAQLSEALGTLRSMNVPLVYTLHDLVNPQLVDQSEHEAQLDVVVSAADAVITLTPGAASVVRERWSRQARVIGHPHVVPLDVPPPLGRAGGIPRVAVHLRDLRPNIDGAGTVAALLAAAAADGSPRFEVVVDINERVRDRAQRAQIERMVDASACAVLHSHPRYDDDALRQSLADASVAVLPYRAGTHSGWLELCWDLGLPVVAPPVGFFAQQHPDDVVVAEPGAMAAGVAEALERSTVPGSPAREHVVARRRAARRAAHAAIQRDHAEVYHGVLA